jgi:hypothetical protein
MTQPQDTNTTTPPAPTTDATGQVPPATPPAEGKLEELPEWARKAIEKANGEAAKYRTDLRAVQEKLANAKTPEDIQAATKELADKNAKLERDLLVAKVAKGDPAKNIPALPDELAALLQGNTEAELRTHAESLRKFAAPAEIPPTQLNGGLDPRNKPDEFDPVKVARAARLGRL